MVTAGEPPSARSPREPFRDLHTQLEEAQRDDRICTVGRVELPHRHLEQAGLGGHPAQLEGVRLPNEVASDSATTPLSTSCLRVRPGSCSE